MTKLQVFDPAMCCSSGVCGTNVDTKLVKFANDLEWAKAQGIEVERYGLAFEPNVFINTEIVKQTLNQEGNTSLPMILVDGELVFKGFYPQREELANACKIEFVEQSTESESDIVNTGCGPDCDCHNSCAGDNIKKAIFIIIVLAVIGIIASKYFSKAHAAVVEKILPVSNQTHYSKLGNYINSIANIKADKEVVFVYLPEKGNENINTTTKNAAIAAQKTLKKKNIKTYLFTLKTSSPDYVSLSAQTKLPSILVIYKGESKKFVTGEINETRLLQTYIAASRTGGCPADCACHK